MRPDSEWLVLSVHKAETNPFRAGASVSPIPDLEIRVAQSLPEDPKELVAAMETDAAELCDYLVTHLPTGTVNRLIGLLCGVKAGEARWPMRDKNGGDDGREAKTRAPEDAGAGRAANPGAPGRPEPA